MKKMICLIICLGLMSGPTLAGKKEKIQELLDLSFGEKGQLESYLSQPLKRTTNEIICRYSLNKSDELQAKYRLNNLLSTENYSDIYTQFYADNYTEEEIDALLEFYKSPVLKKTKELQPQLNQLIAQKQQNFSRMIMPAVKKIASELESKYGQRSDADFAQCLQAKEK